MGNLAAAGLLAGAGQGAVIEGEQMNKEHMAHLDLQRELTIAQLRQGFEKDQQSRLFANEGNLQTQKIGAEQSENQARIDAENTRNTNEITARAGQGDLTRTSEEKRTRMIADQRAQAAKDRLRAAGTPKPASRYEFKPLTNTAVDPKTGVPMTNQQMAVLDKQNGSTYIQNGDKFLPQGVEPTGVRRAASSEVDQLMSNPDSADKFVRTYNYLPAQFIHAQNAAFNANQQPISGTQTGGTGLPGNDGNESDNPADDVAALAPSAARGQ